MTTPKITPPPIMGGEPDPERVVLHRYAGMSAVNRREMLRQLTLDTDEFLALKPNEQIHEVGRHIVKLDAVEDFLIQANLIETGRALKLSGLMCRMSMAQKRSGELLAQVVVHLGEMAEDMAKLSGLLENEESK